MPESPAQPATDLCSPPAAPRTTHRPLPWLLPLIWEDLRAKALRRYERADWKAIVKVVLADGTAAMIVYRLMQWSRRYRLFPLEMLFNKINGVCCSCIIGRGADFGPGFVLLHSQGVVINGQARGGSNVCLEHQVTIGAERNQNPILGNDVYIGCGAKILGAVKVGDGARVSMPMPVVVQDVPEGATVVGIPARVVRQRSIDEK